MFFHAHRGLSGEHVLDYVLVGRVKVIQESERTFSKVSVPGEEGIKTEEAFRGKVTI